MEYRKQIGKKCRYNAWPIGANQGAQGCDLVFVCYYHSQVLHLRVLQQGFRWLEIEIQLSYNFTISASPAALQAQPRSYQ